MVAFRGSAVASAWLHSTTRAVSFICCAAGHGLVASIAIRDGKAWYRSRYVRTPVYVEEVEQRRGVQYRGFGTSKPGGWLANVLDIRDKVVT